MDTAGRLSGVDFGKAVADAVQLATKRAEMAERRPTLGSGFHWTAPWIVGFQIRDVDLAVARSVAETISARVGKSVGVDAVPAVTLIDGDILIGFIERFGDSLRLPATFGQRQR
jgi:hypothetical protein